jgi:hypothetical protein
VTRQGSAMKNSAVLLILCCGALTASDTKPKFSARRDYPSAGGQIVIGDVNGDGIPDVVTIAAQYQISSLLGNGNGTFRPSITTVTTWQELSGGVLADLNGDGNLDLVVGGSPYGGEYPFGIGVCFGNGDGTFQSPIFYKAGSDTYAGNPVIGDFNGDGKLDVLVPGISGIWLFAGQGDGVFSQEVLAASISGAFWVAAGDFNGDGYLDLAVSCSPSGLSVLVGKGNGTFAAPVSIGNNLRAYIVAGNINGDGYPDIVVPGASIYVNNGKGNFLTHYQVSVPGEAVAIGDVNGDGIADLASSEGYVALGLGHGKFEPAVGYSVANTNGWYSVAMAPLITGKKGFDDVVAGLNFSVSVLLNEGNGKFVDGQWISVPGSGNCGAAADFNGDGYPDLAVPTTEGITVLFGTGNGKIPYTTGPSFAVSGAACPITGDLNGDGIPDLLLGANGLGGVGAYLGNGDGSFRLASVISTGPANNLVLGDFNHDGIPDFADSGNTMALGKGDGTFRPPVSILATLPDPGYMQWIAASDVNNDGWTDLVYVAGLDGAGLYILLNNQQGGFTFSAERSKNGFIAVALADLNGDGNLDVVATALGAFATVYIGNGTGAFGLAQDRIPYSFEDSSPAQIGDVNGDGIPDLLLPADGSIGIALGEGNGAFVKPFFIGAGSGLGQVFMQNLHGQSPSAGLPDLVAPDSNGGITVLINTTEE